MDRLDDSPSSEAGRGIDSEAGLGIDGPSSEAGRGIDSEAGLGIDGPSSEAGPVSDSEVGLGIDSPNSEAASRPYRQVARAKARQRTREALIDAALDEFFEGSWEKASLEMLAAKAGVTKQTLLRHFGSKTGLLMQAVASRSSEALNQRWSAPRGDIEGAVENVLDHYEIWGERSLRIGAWLGGANPALARLSQGARQLHYDWVEYAFGPQLEQLEGRERVRCRATLIVLCDVRTWWLLSNDLGFERSEILATLTNAIERLLAEVKE